MDRNQIIQDLHHSGLGFTMEEVLNPYVSVTPNLGLSMHKNVYLSYIFHLVDCVKHDPF